MVGGTLPVKEVGGCCRGLAPCGLRGGGDLKDLDGGGGKGGRSTGSG